MSPCAPSKIHNSGEVVFTCSETEWYDTRFYKILSISLRSGCTVTEFGAWRRLLALCCKSAATLEPPHPDLDYHTCYIILHVYIYIYTYVYIYIYSTSPRNGNRHFWVKQESFYFFLCYPGRQASEFLFSTEKLGPSPRGSDPVPCRLTWVW